MQLFLDSEGIIRCFSRVPYLLIKNKCEAPVLVNAEHPYVYAYIKHRHIWNNCNGTNQCKFEQYKVDDAWFKIKKGN